jgi:FtsH-binding integral membrane protein
MDTVLDILQALGIGAAVGIRPFLPALLVGALAARDLGVDFDGTDFAFLEEPPFLVAMIAGLVIFDFVRRQAGDERLEGGAGLIALAGIALVIAGLQGGGSLADRGGPVVVGILVAVAGAAFALLALVPLFTRVRSRLDKNAAGLLPFYREALALVAAGLSVLFPPLAIVVVGVLAFLMAGGRRREGEKYAGLRILR